MTHYSNEWENLINKENNKMNNLDKIFQSVGELKEKHDIYSTVTIKPNWDHNEKKYIGVSVDVYIAEMVNPFTTGIKPNKAFDLLASLLKDPSEALKTRKEQRIEFLSRQIKSHTKELEKIQKEK
jgi:hypothetical protein